MFTLIIVDKTGYCDSIYSYIGTLYELYKSFNDYSQKDEIIDWMDVLTGEANSSRCMMKLRELYPKELTSVHNYLTCWLNEEEQKKMIKED